MALSDTTAATSLRPLRNPSFRRAPSPLSREKHRGRGPHSLDLLEAALGRSRRYRAAWESNDPVAIGSLFARDARYYDSPGQGPWNGRDAIVEEWIDRKDEPGETTFEYEVIASEGDLGLVRGVTHYLTNGKVYDNLWEIVLDGEERCSSYTEWWVLRSGDSS